MYQGPDKEMGQAASCSRQCPGPAQEEETRREEDGKTFKQIKKVSREYEEAGGGKRLFRNVVHARWPCRRCRTLQQAAEWQRHAEQVHYG
jgi:hypothetical protein